MGDAFKQGGGSWGAISDARLKKNVQDLHGALDKFMALRGVTFEFIDPTAIGERPGTHIGFTAQQVEQVFPDWVGERAGAVKYVAPTGFEALTVAAVTELRHEKDDQVARLAVVLLFPDTVIFGFVAPSTGTPTIGKDGAGWRPGRRDCKR